MKFKVGDRVKIVGTREPWMQGDLDREPWFLEVTNVLPPTTRGQLYNVQDVVSGRGTTVYSWRLEKVSPEIILPKELFEI